VVFPELVAEMRRPNVFLIGAPKCATTALAGWLKGHPQVFMCVPKEPYFFSVDIRSPRAVETIRQYEALFQNAKPGHVAVGEASTTYLRSREAVPRISRYSPGARFIVCLRNPVEMVASVHSQLYKGGRETEPCLEKAWALQNARRKGRCIPTLCTEPADLQYADMCRLGAQVERLLESVKRDQIFFVLLDDLRENPRDTYCSVLRFLDLPDDVRNNFPVINVRVEPRWHAVSRFLAGAHRVKRVLGVTRSTGVGTVIGALNNRRPKNNQGTLEPLRRELQDLYRNDVEKLAAILGRDLRHWVA
jgi:hypothetical protein